MLVITTIPVIGATPENETRAPNLQVSPSPSNIHELRPKVGYASTPVNVSTLTVIVKLILLTSVITPCHDTDACAVEVTLIRCPIVYPVTLLMFQVLIALGGLVLSSNAKRALVNTVLELISLNPGPAGILLPVVSSL